MKVLVIDVGGNNIKMLASGHKQPVKFPSRRSLTSEKMVAGVKKLAANWRYDVVSIGVPEPVLLGQLILDPQNLGPRDAAVNKITRRYREFVNIFEEARSSSRKREREVA